MGVCMRLNVSLKMNVRQRWHFLYPGGVTANTSALDLMCRSVVRSNCESMRESTRGQKIKFIAQNIKPINIFTLLYTSALDLMCRSVVCSNCESSCESIRKQKIKLIAQNIIGINMFC